MHHYTKELFDSNSLIMMCFHTDISSFCPGSGFFPCTSCIPDRGSQQGERSSYRACWRHTPLPPGSWEQLPVVSVGAANRQSLWQQQSWHPISGPVFTCKGGVITRYRGLFLLLSRPTPTSSLFCSTCFSLSQANFRPQEYFLCKAP